MIITFRYYTLLIGTLILTSCNVQSQEKSGGRMTNSTSHDVKTKKVQVIKIENGLNSGFLDRDGNLWFGSNGSGVYRYDGNSFENYRETDGLFDQVYSIIEDKERNIWFGTQNGLIKYDGKTFKHISIPFKDTTGVFLDKVYPVINPNAVSSLAPDKKGNIWVGTAGGGAYRYDGKSFTSYLSETGAKQEDSLYHNWVAGIVEDEKGNIWFASMTHGGVSRYDGETFAHFMPKDGLSDDMVRTIYNDRSGKIWFGFNGNRKSGLTRYDGKTFHTFSTEDGLCNTNIRAIYQDRNGHLWLGSGRGNLCVFNGATFSEFTTKKGQTFEGILFIIQDARENTWFGGRNGLWRFDGESVIDMTK